MAKQQKLDDNWRMTPRQALFVAEYLKDLNATQAAIRAGFSARSAKVTASRMLSNANLQAEIERRKSAQIERAELSAARVLEEYRRLAFSDIGQVLHTMTVAEFKALPAEVRACVASVKVTKKNLTAGDGITEDVVEFRLWDKPKALGDLAKYFGLLVDKVEVSGSLTLIPARLEAARKRLAERNG